MASVTIRLDEGKREALEDLARRREQTVSELLREAIDRLLLGDIPSSLDMVARRSLALSHEILAMLAQDSDTQAEHRRSIEVLSKGYTHEYYREFYSLEAELPPDDGPLLMDILDMFVAVETATEKLDDEAAANLGDQRLQTLRFAGFDYQRPRESRLATLAEHVIAEGRWDSLAHHFGSRRDRPTCPNSHHPVLDRYKRMVDAFKQVIHDRQEAGQMRGVGGIWAGLSAAELATIAVAAQPREATAG